MRKRGRQPDPDPPEPSPPTWPDPVAHEEPIDLEADADAPVEAADADSAAEPADAPEAAEGPEHRRFTVRIDARSRLDVYLQARLKGISRSRVQKLIDLGGVTVNEQLPKSSTAVRSGDVIDVILPPQGIRRIEPEPIPLEVLYEDEHFIVINKQAGLIVHPARSHLSGTLLNALAHRIKQQVEAAGGTFKARQTRGFSRMGGQRVTPPGEEPIQEGTIEGLSTVGATEFRPGIIHRLDKNTTGVIVIGKSDEAHWGIARQFEERSTLKAYLAVVHGNLDTAGGAIEQPIGKHPTIREAMAIRHDSAGRHALTLYRVREQYRGYALVELELKTGRTHQIRVHMAYLGHPLMGDLLYGGEPIGTPELDHPPQIRVRRYLTFARDKPEGERVEKSARAREDLILAHPALHAALLQFTHPMTRQVMRFTAPVHEPMAGLVRDLRKRRIEAPVAKEGCWIDLGQALEQ